MTRYDPAGWDQRYQQASGYLFGEEPSDWLRNVAWRLPRQGRALSVADGEGRNGVWLAEQGLTVETLDGSATAVEKARALAARRGVPLTAHHTTLEDFSWRSEHWDVVVCIFLHVPSAEQPALLARMVAALAPGGVLVFEGFHQRQLGRLSGGPPDLDRLYGSPCVTEAFRPLTTLEHVEGLVLLEEGPGHQGLGEVIRFLGRKPQ